MTRVLKSQHLLPCWYDVVPFRREHFSIENMAASGVHVSLKKRKTHVQNEASRGDFRCREWSLPDGNRPKNLRPSMRRQVLQNILHKRKRLLINILYDVLQHVFPCARRKFANMRC